ncbi:hypothetical protein L5M43_11600 [Shewanella sp. SW36]|uniref:hypothetical protein n=1 Tax=unclassified Shewanella TaxID=196818 RepID=UPI0021DB0C5B|nr:MULTISPECIES: hypothetical protein [unclassified Shewanella]MCU7975896.1 hypothetical protein [Shewanella sp. SW36]MCU7991286.1 hypothetical protein [Shewanella sp. SW1]MCU8052523.1 hypothetical protein [Shewanella sp. SM43]
MNKVFKASIIAATLAAAFGANAADITIDNKLSITKEAAAAGVASVAYGAKITFYNRQELSAGDVVTLTFPIGTVLTSATTFVGAGVGSFETPVFVAGSATVAPTLTMKVATGSPVLNNSKTEVGIVGFLPKVGNAVYTAADGFSGAAKDTTGTNSVALTTSTDQEVVAVATKFNGFLKRDARGTFETSKGVLVAEVSVSRPTATTVAAITAETLSLTGKNFDTVKSVQAAICSDGATPAVDVTSGQPVFSCTGPATLEDVTVLAAAATCGGVACVAPAKPDTFTFDTSSLTAALPTVSTGKSGKIAIAFTSNQAKTFPVGSLTADRSVTYTKVTATNNPVFDYVKAADIGKFQLDASVVNVPYLPVGLGLTPNVEIANAGSTDAAIQLEAFDQNGVAYGPVAIAKVAKKGAVTKVAEADIEAAFGLGKDSGKKLSVTFVLDADAADITLAPYYRQNESRVNVLSDQYKK